MKLITCAKNLESGGLGQYTNSLLEEFNKNEEVEKILVISPKISDGKNGKIQFRTARSMGKTFITNTPSFSANCKNEINEILKEERYDAILTCNSMLLSNKFKSPFISIFHTLHSDYTQIPYKDLKLKIASLFHRIYSYYDYRTIKYSDKAIFVSHATFLRAKKLYPEYKHKFVHIPAFVDISKFYQIDEKDRTIARNKYGLENDKKYLLFVGRLEPLKGISMLINAIESLGNKKIELIVAGKGPLENSVKCKSFVRYMGSVEHKKLNELYNAADLVVLPSYYENCPLVVLEGMASGNLVLASNVGDVRDMLGNRKLIFNVHNIGELKRKINLLLSLDVHEKERICRDLMVRAKRYDKHEISKRLLSIIKKESAQNE